MKRVDSANNSYDGANKDANNCNDGVNNIANNFHDGVNNNANNSIDGVNINAHDDNIYSKYEGENDAYDEYYAPLNFT